MGLFGNVVKEVLNEGYENGGIYVYHMTKRKSVPSICRTGFERFFLDQNSTFYGPIVYCTFWPSIDPRSEVSDPNMDVRRSRTYGDAMLKIKLVNGGFENFLIYDEKIAKGVYKENWRIKDQLKVIMDRNELNNVKSSSYYNTVVNSPDMFHSGRFPLKAFVDHILPHCPKSAAKIQGYIYHGNGDGFCIMPKDFRRFLPVAVSYDFGRTFKPVEVGPHYFDYAINNVDIWKELHLEDAYENGTYKKKSWVRAPFDFMMPYFYGNFALVKNYGLKNYLYKETYKQYDAAGNVYPKTMTETWFDDCPERFIPEGTGVVIEGVKFIVKQLEDGNFYIYLGEDDNIYDKDIMICPLGKFKMERYYEKMQELKRQQSNNVGIKWSNDGVSDNGDVDDLDGLEIDFDV